MFATDKNTTYLSISTYYMGKIAFSKTDVKCKCIPLQLEKTAHVASGSFFSLSLSLSLYTIYYSLPNASFLTQSDLNPIIDSVTSS